MVRNQNATTIIKKLDLLLFPQFALPVSLLLLYQNCYHQLTGFSGLASYLVTKLVQFGVDQLTKVPLYCCCHNCKWTGCL